MTLMLALLPIIAIFILLFGLKQSSLRAGILAYVITIVITLWASEFDLHADEIAHASFKGVLIAFIVAYVVFFGIFLFHLMNRSGKIKEIAAFISQATDDRMMQIIILIAGLSPLIESTSGFGTAFLVVAPILIALGFSRMKAALIGLVSLLAVPWGALATGMVVGSKMVEVPLENTAVGAAIVSLPVFVYFLLVAVYIAGGWQAVRGKWKEILLFSLTFGFGVLFFNLYVSVELAGALAALVTTGVGSVMTKMNRSVVKVISPYLFLTFCILVTRLVPPVSDFLQSHGVLDLPSFDFALPLLYSPAFWLLASCLFAIGIFKIDRKTVLDSIKATWRQWVPFAVSTASFISMAEIMAAAGMTDFIAETAGSVFGTGFVLVSPFIGGLGGFLTASATGSNAIFIKLQVQTAHRVGIPADLLTYAQNAGAAHASMASPSRIILAGSLCEIQSRENELMKKMILIVVGALVLIAGMILGWFWLI
ncbi:MAG TPA: L-lactate permease [Bacillales bacterium]